MTTEPGLTNPIKSIVNEESVVVGVGVFVGVFVGVEFGV
jgi:hypothetical protein